MKNLVFIFSILFSVSQAFSQCGTTIIANDQEVCTNVQFTTNISTDSGTYNIEWLNNNTTTGIPANGSGSTITALPISSGISVIYISASDPSNNCPPLLDTITISVGETPVLVNTPSLSTCSGDAVIVSSFSCSPALANITYNWTNNNVGIGLPSNGTGDISPFEASNLSSICQTAEISVVAFSNWCTSLPSLFTITVCPKPTLNLTSDSTICDGTQIELVAEGSPAGGTYLWNTQESNDTITVSPTSTTSYLAVYQTTDGCFSSDTVTVSIATLDNFNLQDTTICQGGTVLLSAGANSVTCDFAEPICSNTAGVFPNMTNTTAPVGNNYDCLGSQPNPSWFYFQVDQPGDISLTISQTASMSGSGIDVDFIIYGPYSSYAEATTYCGNLGTATSGSGLNTVVNCSYSTSSTETASLSGIQTGEVYIMMLTNYANEPGTILVSQTSGAASLDCSILNNSSTPATYAWSTGETTPWITVIPGNTNSYAVTVTSNGCNFTDSSLVTVNPTPTVSVNNATINLGQSATLTAVGSPTGGSYLWNPTGETTESILVSPTTSTDYTVSYTLNGCVGETTGTVDVSTVGLSTNVNNSISLFPNPAQTSISMKVSEAFIGNNFDLIDQLGRILKTGVIQSSFHEISISHLKNGLYTIRIAGANFKFIKN